MEPTKWLSLNSADARFLMLTAITHHKFSSPPGGSTRSVSSMPNSPSSTGWPPRRSPITTWPDRRCGGRPSAHFCELSGGTCAHPWPEMGLPLRFGPP
jgi:hypothetical protein